MPAKDLDRLREDIVFEETLKGRAFTFHATWGLFNPKRVDPGSRLLIDYIQTGSADRCLDLGCGYGPIGLALGHMCPEGEVQMVDKDFVAIDYAHRNAVANGCSNARVYLSNGFSHVPAEQRFDLVVSNIPAKVGGQLLQYWMTETHRRLQPGGMLWVVTVAGLKDYVKRVFRETFGNHRKVKQSGTHVVAMAIRDQE